MNALPQYTVTAIYKSTANFVCRIRMIKLGKAYCVSFMLLMELLEW